MIDIIIFIAAKMLFVGLEIFVYGSWKRGLKAVPAALFCSAILIGVWNIL